MFTPDSIKTGKVHKPRKVIIYGPPKTGKSTLAASTKNALLIPTEDRVEHIDCAKTPVISSVDELLEIFEYLKTEKKKHTFKRIILDTLDEFEPMLHKKICEVNGWKSLVEDKNKETNFQKGLMYHAVGGWRKFLTECDDLRDHGFDVILVAHSQIIKVNSPDIDTYDRHAMKLDKHALSVVEGWADVIGFYNQEIFVVKNEGKKNKAVTNNDRVLHLSGDSAAWFSGNSYGFGDCTVKLDKCADIMEWLLTDSSV